MGVMEARNVQSLLISLSNLEPSLINCDLSVLQVVKLWRCLIPKFPRHLWTRVLLSFHSQSVRLLRHYQSAIKLF